ncbi:MAG TPA: putative zinc-binding protein [Dissulfurispiraceae bacterium]|nr:putative zinc-binding protein [Dissulfurispiraceae bacterium]
MTECACGEKSNIYVFACSGAADVGLLSDRVARKLSKDGKGKMYCMAAVGANIPEKIAPLKTALGSVTIDGCSSLCAKKVLENAGFNPVSYNLEELGFKKGKTEVNEETISSAISATGL